MITSCVVDADYTVDLALRDACARGDVQALRTFDETCCKDVSRAVAQLGFDAAGCDEVLQQVRELLLVGPSPYITRYEGRGTLRAWVRSIAVRTALKSRRGPRAVELDEDVVLELVAASDDPQLAPFKQRYREAFREAFQDTLASLEVRQRNLFRQYFLDGLTIDQLATMYRAHRSTTARWVTDLREVVQVRLRERLSSQLGLGDGELTSLLGLVQSQLELSLDRLF